VSKRTTIALLLRPCGPLNIANFIMTIIVNTINAVGGRWSRSNSGNQLGNRGKAELYSATSVILVSGILRISTSPASVIKGHAFVSIWDRVAMRRVFRRNKFPAKATATPCVPGGQASGLEVYRVTTLTDTLPYGPAWRGVGVSRHKQTAKRFTNKIEHFSHAGTLPPFSLLNNIYFSPVGEIR